MRWVVLAALGALAASACAHAGIRKVSDCGEAPVEQRIACGACTAKNEAQGLLGAWAYFPEGQPGDRCRQVK